MRVSKGKYCAAVNCSNNYGKNPDMSFFRFPRDEERCKRWLINTRRDDLLKKRLSAEYMSKNFILCREHFEDHQFMNQAKNKLIGCAVPTIFNGSPFESHRKVVEILCFDGQQYRYIYRGNETVCNIKLECADGVELFVSLEDLDELEPAILKTSRNKLLDLNASDVTNDASPKEGVSIPKPVLSELYVKEDSPLSFLSTTFVSQGSNSDDGTVEDDSNVLLELCTQTGTYERKEVKSLCQENNQVYSCDKSKLTLKKKGKLQSHRGVNSREHPFKCYRCSKTFKTKVYYERHVKTHSDKSSFLCSDCGKSFSRNNQMKDHQRRVHHKGTHSKCDICARGFTTTRDLKHHLQTVHNEKTFGCKERWTHDLTNS